MGEGVLVAEAPPVWTVLDACLGGLLHPYVQPCVCVCACACASACACVCVCVCVCLVCRDTTELLVVLLVVLRGPKSLEAILTTLPFTEYIRKCNNR